MKVAALLVAAVASAHTAEEADEVSAYLVRLCPEAADEHGRAAMRSLALESPPESEKHAARRALSRHVHATFTGRNRGYYVGGLTKAEAEILGEQEGVCRVNEDYGVKKAGSYNWGIERITERRFQGVGYSLPLPSDGRGVDIYVIDTGLDSQHCEWDPSFGQVQFHQPREVSTVLNLYDNGRLLANSDVDGHGTHVAAIAAGITVGVASGANVRAIKALDDLGRGTIADIVESFQFAREEHERRGGPSVIVASIEGERGCKGVCDDDAMYLAAVDAMEAGVFVALAAGNIGSDACDYAPGAAGILGGIMTVGAMDAVVRNGAYVDELMVGTNFGSCVDIYAPGEQVASAFSGGDCDYTALTGTSQATPFVAGVAAQHLQWVPKRTPSQLEDIILNDALKGTITDLPGDNGGPNVLLQQASGIYGTFAPTAAPVDSPTSAPVDCMDSTSWQKNNSPDKDRSTWFKNLAPTKDCSWVADYPYTPEVKRCLVKGGEGFAFEECKSACGSCGVACVDSGTWHKGDDTTKGCSWVREYFARCGLEDDDGVYASQACRASCQTCDLETTCTSAPPAAACEDSGTWQKTTDDVIKDCAWLYGFDEEDRRGKCLTRSDSGVPAFGECKSACGSCGKPCVDDETWVMSGDDSSKDCDWVKQASNRCSWAQSDDGTYAADACLAACHTCDLATCPP